VGDRGQPRRGPDLLRALAVTVSVAVPETERHAFGAARAMAKTADDRLALAAAIQLGEHDVASVAIHPGRVRTEGVLQFADQVDLSSSQSPEGVGGPSPRWPATRR